MIEHIPLETEEQLINGTGCECPRCKPQGVIEVYSSSGGDFLGLPSSSSSSSKAISPARYPPQFVRQNRKDRRKAASEARKTRRSFAAARKFLRR